MSFEDQILSALSKKTYQPLKPKALARKLGIGADEYSEFRRAIRSLVKQERIEIGKNHTLRLRDQHETVIGIFRRAPGGFGFVRPHPADGEPPGEIFIKERHTLDAVTGDEVLVRITRKPRSADLNAAGVIVRVIERATREFVGTYFERDGDAFVRVDGSVFQHSIYVGDPGAKGAKPDDKVVIEMLRFPSPEDRGEGVITEVLGRHGDPGVDTISVIRAFGIPDTFSEDALNEARAVADAFDESLKGREDLTGETIITIDPADARDFDDAISLVHDSRTKHWLLGVHIADVSHFVRAGGALDREARKRGTSVYLPQRVIPMLPELISNGLASLQEQKLRYTKSVFIDFTPSGQRTQTRFTNAAIKVRKRFTYEQVSEILASPDKKPPDLDEDVFKLLFRMRDLALILRQRRKKRGALELNLPETELEFDEQGKVTGAHFVHHDISHQIIEEFMLAANEAVAEHLHDLGATFLRRVHAAPDPKKLQSFAEFVRLLGYKIDLHTDRFALQRVLEQAAQRPDVYAVHFALLRSLKQAVYSPEEEEHYALASRNYCHFTSPIRRYPDLTVHRLLGRWLRTRKVGSDEKELIALGEHCSKMERRAEMAERELIKIKLLDYLSHKIGMEMEVIVTGVADYGFYGQAEELPIEGRVHVSTLTDDYYYFDEQSHSLIGQRTKNRYRLGDKVRVTIVRVDLQRRHLDFRVVGKAKR
ncbi:MAG: ribonuclease R [Gemmatales bacterium]|nr:MAG: ribonuclease R [Gemmatales bacterium]